MIQISQQPHEVKILSSIFIAADYVKAFLNYSGNEEPTCLRTLKLWWSPFVLGGYHCQLGQLGCRHAAEMAPSLVFAVTFVYHHSC